MTVMVVTTCCLAQAAGCGYCVLMCCQQLFASKPEHNPSWQKRHSPLENQGCSYQGGGADDALEPAGLCHPRENIP
jgi:hypothetical protein